MVLVVYLISAILVLFNGHFSNFFEALMRAGSVLDVEGSGRDGGYNGPRLAGHDDTMVQRGLSPGPSHSDLKAGLLLGRYSSVGEIRRTHYNNRLPLTTGTPIIIAAMWVYQVLSKAIARVLHLQCGRYLPHVIQHVFQLFRNGWWVPHETSEAGYRSELPGQLVRFPFC